MLGGDRKWSTQSTNNFTGVRNEQHGSLGNLCLTVPFLNAYGGPNHERSSPPLLTVLLLLTGEHQREGGWVEKTRGRDLWGENPGVFFCALWNLPDCARREMLQTDFCREMGCSESFVDVRDLPHPFGVGNPDDFGKTFVLVR